LSIVKLDDVSRHCVRLLKDCTATAREFQVRVHLLEQGRGLPRDGFKFKFVNGHVVLQAKSEMGFETSTEMEESSENISGPPPLLPSF
jgi:hypothetical protein